MCLTCNPYCGRCHPPRKHRPVRCPECQKMNDIDAGQGDDGICFWCGAKLPEQRTKPTVHCKWTGEYCSDPCGRARETPPGNVKQECADRLPPVNAREFVKTLRHGPFDD